jgi:hypothetical protein
MRGLQRENPKGQASEQSRLSMVVPVSAEGWVEQAQGSGEVRCVGNRA